MKKILLIILAAFILYTTAERRLAFASNPPTGAKFLTYDEGFNNLKEVFEKYGYKVKIEESEDTLIIEGLGDFSSFTSSMFSINSLQALKKYIDKFDLNKYALIVFRSGGVESRINVSDVYLFHGLKNIIEQQQFLSTDALSIVETINDIE